MKPNQPQSSDRPRPQGGARPTSPTGRQDGPTGRPQGQGRDKRGSAHKEAARASRRNFENSQARFAMEQPDRPNRNAFGGKSSGGQKFGAGKALRVIPLGGLGEVGKNLNIIEFGNDAIIVDAGIKLGVDLPGINFAIPEFTYLEKIKDKLRGYVFTHGHLDHVAAMPFLLADYPAPLYGSRFTIDMLERIMMDRDPNAHLDKRYLNPDNHEQVQIGSFKVSLARVTHSIPDSTVAVIETPVGTIVDTGDYKFDPTPLDGKVSDKAYLKEIGDKGVLLLMGESTNCESLDRTPTEQVIAPTIDSLVRQAPGRVIISAVSTNINRIQMIMDAVAKAGRKVAIDGRSMLANIEMSVRNGYIRIPKGTIVAMRDVAKIPDNQLAVISTGHQGELGSVLMRMSTGEHRFIKLKQADTVVLSASPIPGNEKAVVMVVDKLMREGAIVFQHAHREIDGIGPLHVSGHGNREELAEMIQLVRPKFFMPIHGEFHHQVRHAQLAVENGIPRDNVFVMDNGDVLELTQNQAAKGLRVPGGSQLVDQTGEVVPNLVIQDRLLMSQDGIVVVVLTIDRKNGNFLSSPDIITRGFIHIRDSEDLMNDLRDELRNFSRRRFGKVEINRFKQELRDDINGFLFNQTQKSPIIIPVINIIDPQAGPKPAAATQPQAA